MKLMALKALAAFAIVMSAALPAAATCRYNCAPVGGSASAWFNGSVGSENSAGAVGKLTFAMTQNQKTESGFANVLTGTGMAPVASAGAHVATSGSGAAGALSGGYGPALAQSGVAGVLGGDVSAGVSTNR